MAIGDGMAEVFQARYGRSLSVFQNAIDVAVWSGYECRERSPSRAFTVLYAGHIGHANAGGVRDIAEAVASLVSEGLAVELVVYSGDACAPAGTALGSLAGVRVLPSQPYATMPKILGDADLLVLPLDFDRRSIAFARLSMPTKMPEFMASGTPTLVYAPAGTALAEDARRLRWGCVVDRQGVAGLRTAISRLIDDDGLRADLGRTAQHVAQARHDVGVVRPAFRAALLAAAEVSRLG
jgi:glycosyltransferase involved in cell wall biosynthesis